MNASFNVVLLLSPLAVGDPAQLQVDNPEAVTLSMDAAHQQWLSEVAFKCTYTQITGVAPDVATALTAINDPLSSPDTSRYFGSLIKWGTKVRQSERSSTPPSVRTRSNGRIGWSNLPKETVTNGIVSLDYIAPVTDRLVGQALGMPLQSTLLDAGPTVASTQFSGQYTPLNMLGGVGRTGYAFPLKPEFDPTQRTIEREVSAIDSEHIQVLLLEKAPWGSRTKRFVYWTVPTIPVLREAEYIYHSARTRRSGGDTAVASDFVDCGGLMVPRHVRVASWYDTGDGAGRSTRFIDWSSSDLGLEPPVSEDFVVTLPPGVVLAGLRLPPRVDVARQIDVNVLSLDDLGEPVLPPAGQSVISDLSVIGRVVAVVLALVAMSAVVYCIRTVRRID